MQPLLEIKNIRKSFGAVEAIKDISFNVDHGEVIALVGDNGAGKSTLVKIISGVHAPTNDQHIKIPAALGGEETGQVPHQGRRVIILRNEETDPKDIVAYITGAKEGQQGEH